jgi:hypothetical protein
MVTDSAAAGLSWVIRKKRQPTSIKKTMDRNGLQADDLSASWSAVGHDPAGHRALITTARHSKAAGLGTKRDTD